MNKRVYAFISTMHILHFFFVLVWFTNDFKNSLDSKVAHEMKYKLFKKVLIKPIYILEEI